MPTQGGQHPVAVGIVFQCLVTKTACLCLGNELKHFFCLASELRVAVRQRFMLLINFLSSSFPICPLVLLKVDNHNAFNSVRRDCFLQVVSLFISLCLASLFWRLHYFICYWSATKGPFGSSPFQSSYPFFGQ